MRNIGVGSIDDDEIIDGMMLPSKRGMNQNNVPKGKICMNYGWNIKDWLFNAISM